MPIKENKQRIMITLEDGIVTILDESRGRFTKCKLTRSEYITMSIIAFTQALIDKSLQEKSKDGKEVKGNEENN